MSRTQDSFAFGETPLTDVRSLLSSALLHAVLHDPGVAGGPERRDAGRGAERAADPGRAGRGG